MEEQSLTRRVVAVVEGRRQKGQTETKMGR